MKAEPAISAALRELLHSAGLPESKAEEVRYGAAADPVFRTQYKVATGGAAALGAVAVAMADIREAQTGKRPGIDIDVRAATASLRSSKYVRIDGERPAERQKISGFYPAANNRWIYFHCSHPPHEAAVLRVLGVPADKARVAEAVAKWDAFALEEAVHREGGVAPAVRTPEEWRALPNTPALASEPLVDVRQIGDSAPIPLPEGSGGNGGRPLSGLRMLDLTRVLAGPTCGRLLAESGADVLKVACDEHPDMLSTEADTGYLKRKLTLDMSSAAGREQLTRLLGSCDVFSQAYRPGSLAGRGFGPEQVTTMRPGIVYASLNAYGYTGDWKMRRGYDTAVQAASGMAYTSGRGKEPRLTPVTALDYIAGYLMTFGVLVALKRRHDVGGSYAVNVSLGRCQAWLVSMGLHDTGTADGGVEELEDIAKLLIEVETPLGRLRRLRPVIRYSEQAMNELAAWRDHGHSEAAWMN